MKVHEHPSLTCYQKHRCRCDGCRKCNRDKNRVYRVHTRARRYGETGARTYRMPTTIARLYREIGIVIHPKAWR